MEPNDEEFLPVNEVNDFHKRLKPTDAATKRLVRALKHEALVQAGRKTKIYYLAAAAVIVIGAALVYFVTNKSQTHTQMADGQFILLLREDSAFSATPNEIPRLIQEYSNWGKNASDEGRLVYAEKLTDESIELGRRGESPMKVTGYFVIRAASIEDATTFAKTHPHLKYNGGIELRQIDVIN